MAKFHDKVGFLIPYDNQETGMAGSTAVERTYYGRILEHTRRWESTEHVNDDLAVSNQIAITANDYANWKVTSIRVKAPEIVLTLGGVWNGPTAVSAGTPCCGA